MNQKIIILFALFAFLLSCSSKTVKNETTVQTVREQKTGPVEAEKAYDMIINNRDNPSFVIIDVRSENEYAEGHIPGALNLDYASGQFENSVKSLDRNKTYLLYCSSSRKSEKAVSDLKELGFLEAYHIFGGLTEWERKGYPVVK